MPCLLHMFFMLSLKPLTYGRTMQGLFWPLMFLVCSLLFRSCFVGALILIFTPLRAQLGYFQVPFVNNVLLHPIAAGLNIELLPCDVGCSPHCTLLQWYGGYPTADINLYWLVFCIPLCSNCPLNME